MIAPSSITLFVILLDILAQGVAMLDAVEAKNGVLDGHKSIIQLPFLFGLLDDDIGRGDIPDRKGLPGGQIGQGQLIAFKKQPPAALAHRGIIHDAKAKYLHDL